MLQTWMKLMTSIKPKDADIMSLTKFVPSVTNATLLMKITSLESQEIPSTQKPCNSLSSLSSTKIAITRFNRDSKRTAQILVLRTTVHIATVVVKEATTVVSSIITITITVVVTRTIVVHRPITSKTRISTTATRIQSTRPSLALTSHNVSTL